MKIFPVVIAAVLAFFSITSTSQAHDRHDRILAALAGAAIGQAIAPPRVIYVSDRGNYQQPRHYSNGSEVRETAHIAFTRGHYDRTGGKMCDPSRVHPSVAQYYIDGWQQADNMLRNDRIREAQDDMQWRIKHRRTW